MATRLIESVKKIKVVIIRVDQFRIKPSQKQPSIKFGNNRSNATAWKDDTPEQIKKVIIQGDSVVKHVRGYDLSHSVENCKVHVKNFSDARIKCMQD